MALKYSYYKFITEAKIRFFIHENILFWLNTNIFFSMHIKFS